MGLKNYWAHVSIHVLNVMMHPSKAGLPPHSCNDAAFCQSVMATCLHPLPETVHTQKRNLNVASRCWWGSDCDCLRCCRGALRWRKRALHTAEGAAVYVVANRPEISAAVQELAFESCPVTWQVLECFYRLVDDIKSPCRSPWKGSGNGLFTVPALIH